MKKNILVFLFTISFMFSYAQFNGKPQYEIITTQLGDTLGYIQIELYPTIAPKHVANFDSIVNAPINFDNRAFHRIIPNFMIQGGDPNSISGPESTWGQGNPSQANVNAEFNPISHLRGIISAARATDPNSASSQFFICHGNPTHLDGNYTAYGNVISGIEIVDSIAIKPRNSSDLPNNKISMFIKFIGIDSTVPSKKPVLTSPSNLSIDVQKDVVFYWNKVDTNDFLTYKIQFSTDSLFNTIEFEKDMDTSNNFTSSQNLKQGYIEYYWRICTNNGGKLNCSNAFSFKTFIAPPIQLTPSFEQLDATIQPHFYWNKVKEAEAYHLQISKNSNFLITSQIVIDTIVSDTFFITNDTLLMNTKHHWRVNSIINAKEGDFSPTWYFVVSKLNSISNHKTTNLTIYPNPSVGNFIFQINQELKGSITIHNQLGEIVYEEKIKRKTDQLNIDISNNPNGIYYFTLSTSDNEIERGKLTIKKQL